MGVHHPLWSVRHSLERVRCSTHSTVCPTPNLTFHRRHPWPRCCARRTRVQHSRERWTRESVGPTLPLTKLKAAVSEMCNTPSRVSNTPSNVSDTLDGVSNTPCSVSNTPFSVSKLPQVYPTLPLTCGSRRPWPRCCARRTRFASLRFRASVPRQVTSLIAPHSLSLSPLFSLYLFSISLSAISLSLSLIFLSLLPLSLSYLSLLSLSPLSLTCEQSQSSL
jgi:hypothetical protein